MAAPNEIRRISGSISIGDPNAAVTTDTEKFGPVTGHIDESLALVLTADDVPDDKVKSFTLTGRLRGDNTGFDATYAVVFEDGTTADGTVARHVRPGGQPWERRDDRLRADRSDRLSTTGAGAPRLRGSA